MRHGVLFPGRPPKKVSSVLSQGPRHSESAASIKPSLSLSWQSPLPSGSSIWGAHFLGIQSESALPPDPRAPPDPLVPPVVAGSWLFSPISTSSLHAALPTTAPTSSARHQLRDFMSTRAQGFVAFWTLRR